MPKRQDFANHRTASRPWALAAAAALLAAAGAAAVAGVSAGPVHAVVAAKVASQDDLAWG
ncbi:hypothetical protein ABTY61_18470 [Kitasatospora sp. NPDC096128]|uniref:hypothetical protein n=1 Tax=Kitasatospora sp. NPDC096128 TaxID=3155547 RepID=UPI00331D8E30